MSSGEAAAGEEAGDFIQSLMETDLYSVTG
jgi:hypothetical protein